ncbi:hypothetical protein PSACC_02359 [Paramicrosporidium saccamoebae]|uniref:Uncharacterized protein n=1 Tax=Paramicrosporidium saccamoebae TaxID=1246581 RepID=A0A2H9TJA8_9FUNG|nr:hypothetical protein PSACC_02359 [Paramicrosporidium saccamoebae]
MSNLPSTISKSLDAGQSNASKPTLSFRAFISTKKEASADPVKPHGPQRVAAKVAPFHPYPSEPSSLKKSVRVESTKLPTRAIKSTLSAPPTLDNVHKPHRIVSSASAHQLPSLAKVMLPRSGSSSAITSPKRTVSMDSHILPPTPKSLLYDFFEGVKRVEWNVRYKSLVDFLEIMERPDIVEFMLSHRPTTGRLFEIFFGGLGDVHYKVVFMVVEFGKKLLKLIPAEKVPEVALKTEKIIHRLFYVATNIQFKAKPSLIEDAHRLVDDIIEWSAPGKRIQVLTSCKGKSQYPNVTKAIEERIIEERMLEERILEDDVQVNTIVTLQSPRKLHPDHELLLGSPMKGVTRGEGFHPSSNAAGGEGFHPSSNAAGGTGLFPSPNANATGGVGLFPSPNSNVTGEEFLFPSPDSNVTEEGEIIPSPRVFHDDEIILDAELGISLRPKTMPSTPVSRLRQVVDFDTPRSMDHHIPIETDSEVEENDPNCSAAQDECEPSGKDEQVSNIMQQLEL